MAKNYYDILGVSKSASKDEVKKAFRKLAHEHHPDKKGGDDKRFKEASEAYSVLSDDQKRAQYDQFGDTSNMGGGGNAGFGGFDFNGFQGGFGGQQGGFQFDMGDLGDIFGDIFGGGGGRRTKPKKGNDIQVDLELDFKESIFGVKKKININKISECKKCHGNGAEPGSDVSTCKTCGGAGVIQEIKRSIFGQIASEKTCPDCHGVGAIPKNKCSQCRGAGVLKQNEEIEVSIPSGIENGEMLRVSGRGEAMRGGSAGDLYIKIHVKAHKLFKKEGQNLVANFEIKLTDALLGAEIPLETLDGNLQVKVPEGVKHGEILRVRGKGVPSTHGAGDILLKISVKIPHKLSRDARKLVEELRKEGL